MNPMDRNIFMFMRVCLLVAIASTTAAVQAQRPPVLGLLEENQRRRQAIREEFVPVPVDGRFRMPPLEAPSTSIMAKGEDQVPRDFRDDQGTVTEPLPEGGSQRAASWNWTVKNWEAANTFSNPRYFEDRMLERHGQERFGCCQPLASGARFFATVPMLPYLMTVSEPCDCEYTLGYYRSGSCTPAFIQRPPYERRAMVMEALVVSGVTIGFP